MNARATFKFMETASFNNKKHNRSVVVNDEAIRTAVLGLRQGYRSILKYGPFVKVIILTN